MNLRSTHVTHAQFEYFLFFRRSDKRENKKKQKKTKQTKREREMPAGCKGEERSKFERLVCPPQRQILTLAPDDD